MAATMTWRSANPAFGTEAFQRSGFRDTTGAMTVVGTVNKTALSLLILAVTAGYVWNRGVTDPYVGTFTMAGVFGGLIVALATVFKPAWAPLTTPLYAALEGLALGGISLTFERAYPGIAGQAVFLTLGTLGALLLAYRAGIVKATEKFRMGVAAATGGILLVYLLTFVLGLFGVQVPLLHSNGLVGIGFSLFVVAIAALNLVLDFDLIETGARTGAPRYMEWYGAFALLVTLVWLYLEMLRLLAKLQSRER